MYYFRNLMDRDLDDLEPDYEDDPDYDVESNEFRFVTLSQAVTMSQIALDLGLVDRDLYGTERKRRNALRKLYSWFYEKDITRKESGWRLH